MCETGDGLHQGLDHHFHALQAARGANRVVFALEHGLEAEELAILRAVVAAGSQSDEERSRHWLLWIVHATEIAYDYQGDEYWGSFASATPEWDDRQRHWIRQLFQNFAATYGGPTPRGPWAETFGIIAWPITNAILPTDLQRHLARALYQARAGLAARLGDTQELGHYVASVGGEGSDRYNQLRQQPNLLGQIALALLRPEQTTDELLLEATLRRIAANLEEERSARTNLRGARRAVEQTNLNLGGARHTVEPIAAAPLGQRIGAAARSTSPKLVLRPNRSVPGEWSAWIQLPDLSPIAAVDATVADALRTSRSWVPASDRPVATGQLLRAEQELLLARWPIPGSPLLRFQGMASGLESALLAEWAAPDMPSLFGLQAGGQAVQILSRAAHVGRQYIVAHEQLLTAWEGFRVPTSCTGVTLYAMNLTNDVPAGFAARLQELGIFLARTSRIWPAVNVPVSWDGEASGEWLSDDIPVLGISPDHDLRRLQFDLDGAVTATYANLAAGRRMFAVLPKLSVGEHRLTIREESTRGSPAVRDIGIAIRTPRLNPLGEAGPVRVWVEPYSRNLAALWDGRASVCIAGPGGSVDISFGLAERPRNIPEIVFQTRLPVPLGPISWRPIMTEISHDEKIGRYYDDARWGLIRVNAGKFGTYNLEFERSLPALRWRSRRASAGELGLIDETAVDLDQTVTFSAFARPAELVPVEVQPGQTIGVDPLGGLYVARVGDMVAPVIAAPTLRRLRSLDQLRLEPEVAPVSNESTAILLSELMAMWASTPLPGNPVARLWRSRSVRELHHQLLSWICGSRWIEAEDRVRQSKSAGAWLELCRTLTSRSPTALADALEITKTAPQAAERPAALRIESLQKLTRHASQFAGRTWTELNAIHGDATRPWVAELWLRIATDPGFMIWTAGHHRAALAFASEWPLPIRTARCLALWTIIGTEGEPADFPPLLNSWDWL